MGGFQQTSKTQKAKAQPKKRQRTSGTTPTPRSRAKDRSSTSDVKSASVSLQPMESSFQKLEQVTAAALWNGTLKEREVNARLASGSQAMQSLTEAKVLGTAPPKADELIVKLEEKMAEIDQARTFFAMAKSYKGQDQETQAILEAFAKWAHILDPSLAGSILMQLINSMLEAGEPSQLLI
jgi:hypothetical protein